MSRGPKMLLIEFSFAFAHLRFYPASYRLKLAGTVSYTRDTHSLTRIDPVMSENESEHAGELWLEIPLHKIWFPLARFSFDLLCDGLIIIGQE